MSTNLVPCPDCKRNVSTRAVICPGCGRPRPAGSSSVGKFLIIFMVIFAVIAIIAAIAIPNLIESRKMVNEVNAIASVRMVFQAQQQFRILKKKGGQYGTLRELTKTQLLSGIKVSAKDDNYGTRNGYFYTMKVSSKKGWHAKFSLVARPLTPGDGTRSFFVDESGSITYTKDGSTPNAKSMRID